jgi:hypothetical protein
LIAVSELPLEMKKQTKSQNVAGAREEPADLVLDQEVVAKDSVKRLNTS